MIQAQFMDAARESATPAIVFFDGVCNLCNAYVDWLIAHDTRNSLRIASLQGQTAARLLPPELLQPLDSIVLLENDRHYRHSTAVLRIAAHLPGWPQLLRIGWIVPRPLRDLVYRLVAKSRYRWFGRRATCRVPTAAEQARFLP